jgi:hypothetical protein
MLLYWMLAGRIVPRERYRDEEYDLVRLSHNRHLEHVNRILDHLIVEDAQRRESDANVIATRARRVMDLIGKNYQPISGTVPQVCTYCGQGLYRARNMDNPTAVRNFGIEAVANAQWQAFVCETCGHVQLFRLDLATDADLWRQ